MQIAVLADIHANLEALKAVLADVAAQGIDDVVVLGDLVGYGPDPNACLDVIRQRSRTRCLKGNNDVGTYDDDFFADPDRFNPAARQAMQWTRNQLTGDDREYLRQLPYKLYLGYGVVGVHGTLNSPEEFDYICCERAAGRELLITDNLEATFALMRKQTIKICLFGHSHVPVVFREDDSMVRLNFGAVNEFAVSHYGRCVVACVGAVGQPRGIIPRADGTTMPDAYKACYAILDDDLLTFRRVDYDVDQTLDKIYRNPNLPDWLGDRLRRGE